MKEKKNEAMAFANPTKDLFEVAKRFVFICLNENDVYAGWGNDRIVNRIYLDIRLSRGQPFPFLVAHHDNIFCCCFMIAWIRFKCSLFFVHWVSCVSYFSVY